MNGNETGLETLLFSVVVCTKDRPRDLERFIRSLDKQTLLPNELIIVDASNNSRTRQLIECEMQRAKYSTRYIKAEPSSARQRNIGAREARSEYVLFFDDDIILEANFIEVMYETFRDFEGQNVGGITGRIINVKTGRKAIHRIEDLFKKLFLLTEIGTGRLKASGFPSLKNDNQFADVNVFSSCLAAFRRRTFSEFWFDEALGGYAYMEDIDLSYRVGKKYRLLYQPRAKAQHMSTTYKAWNSRQLRRKMIQNHSYIFRKNLPQDFPHLFAHLMSIIGNLLVNMLFWRDFQACIGIMEGFWYGTICKQGPYDGD